MANAAKAKGTRWERDVREYLRANGFPRAYKPYEEGFEDVGDIHAGDAVLQAKDWVSWQSAIREGLDGAVRQAAAWDGKRNKAAQSAGMWDATPVRGSVPAAVVKRARKPVADAYVVMRLEDFARLLAR